MAKFDLKKYKQSIKVADTPLKEASYVQLNDALKPVLGLPGIPLGHITQVYGLSDTGKTSLLFHTAAQAQKQGILPVVIVTEGKVDWNRAAQMGFDKDSAIVNEDCEFLENAFQFIDKITADVSMGELPQDVMIFWDSVGNTLSKDEVTINKDGTWEKKSTMMKAAKTISENMRTISKKINDTRKQSYPKSVGLMILNQAYVEPPKFPGAPSRLVPYGGNAIWYRSSIVIKTSRVKKLTAIKNGDTVGFGIISKISVDKNHISNSAHSGEFVITASEILPNEAGAIKDYKDTHSSSWGSIVDENGEELGND
jgi:recombination protein RecA